MSGDTTNSGWNRISPLSVVFFLFNAARHFAVNGLPAIAVIVAAYAAASEGRKALILTGLLIAVIAGILASALQWLRFRFRITRDRVLVRRGVLRREELSVEFDRIQNVNIREPFYMRPFGLALLSIDTAGSGEKEIILGGIPKPVATDLRNTILAKEHHDESESTEQGEKAGGESILLSRETREIVIYGLTANFMLWIAIALGAFFSTVDAGEEFGAWVIDKIDPEAALSAMPDAIGIPVVALILAGVLLLVFIILPLISVLGALFRHHGYKLSVDGETYRKSSGLLTRFDESLKRHKIQAAVLRQNIVARFFRRTNLQLRLASAGSAEAKGQIPVASKAVFQVPVLRDDELPRLIAEFFPGCKPGDAAFTRINRRQLSLVVLGLGILPPAMITTLILALTLHWLFLFLLPLVLAMAWPVVNQVWTKLGYGVAGDFGFVRKGFLGTQTTVFPLFKAQRVDIRQTPGQRRKGLASLSIHLASHSLRIPYISEQDAKMFRDMILFHVESTNRAWY